MYRGAVINAYSSSASADDTGYIPGIYSYCDRWCAHCAFTARCRSYAIASREPGSGDGPDSEEFWKKLSVSFEKTLRTLQDEAARAGMDITPEIMSLARLGQPHPLQLGDRNIALDARSYISMVNEWFVEHSHLFEMKEQGLQTLIDLGAEEQSMEEAAGIIDALEVIRWYQYFISAKLARGLRSREYEREERPREGEQSDADGSVKAALVAIDRSIGAWGELMDRFPDCADSILSILLHLDRLRRACELEFPDARAFIRPGFDTNG